MAHGRRLPDHARQRVRGWRTALAVQIVGASALVACAAGPSNGDGHGGGSGGVSTALFGAVQGAPGGASPPPAQARKQDRKPPAPAALRSGQETGPLVPMVTIHVLVEPPQRAHVVWGAKDYGLGPVDIHRPRGSGPLDLVIRAPGFLTLHTRAFTERDNTLSVHLVPEAQASRFSGFQPAAPTVATHAMPPATARRATARPPRAGNRTTAAATDGDATSDGAGAP